MDEYESKLLELQKYVPFLEKIMENLRKDGKPREAELERIQMLYTILTNKRKKCKIETLLKCESVLEKLHSSWEKRNAGHGKNESTASSSKEVLQNLSGPASPQENFDKTAENHKPIEIPTERRDYYDRDSHRDVRDYDHTRSDSPREDRELYRRRSPSRYSNKSSEYDQYSNSDEFYRRNKFETEKSKWSSSEIYEQKSDKSSGYKSSSHTVTSEHNDRSKGSTSSQSIFHRLGEKFDVTSKDSYENFQIKVTENKTRIALPPQPIADVLKSPPLSENDINDLMNEACSSIEKFDKYDRKEKNRSEGRSKNTVDVKNLNELEVARRKLIKIDVSSNSSPKRTDSPKPNKSKPKEQDFDKEKESVSMSNNKLEPKRSESKKELTNKPEKIADIHEFLKNKSESSIKLSNEINKPSLSTDNQSDVNNVRLAYKYNPHPRKNTESSSKTESYADKSRPSDPRKIIHSHSTLPSVSPSDPRLKSRTLDSSTHAPTKATFSSLDTPMSYPYGQAFHESSRNIPKPVPPPVIPPLVPPPLIPPALVPPPLIPPSLLSSPLTQTSIVSQPPIIPAVHYPKTTPSLMSLPIMNPQTTYSKFRPIINDHVERMKYLESKRYKTEPRNYREYRLAKQEAERQKKASIDQNGSEGSDKSYNANINKTSSLNPSSQKSVLDSMYRNSNWQGELSHVSSSFKIPKLNKGEKSKDDEIPQKSVQKSSEEDVISDKDKRAREENMEIDDEENWDDIDNVQPQSKKEKKDEQKPVEKSKVENKIDNDEENWDDIDFNEVKPESKDEKKNEEKREKKHKHGDKQDHKHHSKHHKEKKMKSEKRKSEQFNVSENDTTKKQQKDKLIDEDIHKQEESKKKEKKVKENINVENEQIEKTVSTDKAHEEEQQEEKVTTDEQSNQNEIQVKMENEEYNGEYEGSPSKNASKIRQRRQSTAPSYVYIEVPDGEEDDDKSVISTKNIIEGKRGRKSTLHLNTERRQSPSPSASKKSISPSSVSSVRSSSAVSTSSTVKSSPTKPNKTKQTKTKSKNKKGSKKSVTSAVAINTECSETEKTIETDQSCVVSSTTVNTSVEGVQPSSIQKSENISTEEKQRTGKTGLDPPLVNLIHPDYLNKENVLGLLERVLDKDKFLPIKQIIENDKKLDDVIKKEEIVNEKEIKNDVSEKIDHNEKLESQQEKQQQQQQQSTHSQKPKPHKTELDRLNEDIRDMFISKEVITATGRRICAINAEKKQIEAKQREMNIPYRIIGPKCKMQKLKRAQKKKKIGELKYKKFPYTDEDLFKKMKIKQLKVKVRKPCWKTWKKNFNLNFFRNSLKNRKENNESCDMNNEVKEKNDINDENIPTVPVLKSEKKLKKYDRPCPKSKKKFIQESEEDDDDDDYDDDRDNSTHDLSEKFQNSSENEDHNNDSTINAIENESQAIENVKPKPIKIMKKKKRTKRGRPPIVKSNIPASTLKNNNSSMHSKSVFMQKCVLCETSSSGKPNHYITVHPDGEVYVSRLPPDTLISLKQNNCVRLARLNKKYKVITYQHSCPFCDSIISISKKMWLNHIGMHTGEYGYKCSNCQRKFSVLPAVSSHLKHHCKSARSINLRDNIESPRNIKTYLCNLCNYIQMNKNNIVKHLRTEHDMTDEDLIERNISDLIIFEFEDGEAQDGRVERRGRKKKVKKIWPSSAKELSTDNNLIEGNIEAFLPNDENDDLNVDPNFLKYMNEISFKTPDSHDHNSLKSNKSSTSIIDQLSMKINSNHNSNNFDDKFPDIFPHSIFSNIMDSPDDDENLENVETILNIDNEEIENDQSKSTTVSINNENDSNSDRAKDNDSQSFESWQNKYSQQISDGGLSLADHFDRSIPNCSNSNEVIATTPSPPPSSSSMNIVDKISEKIQQKSNESSPTKPNDNDESRLKNSNLFLTRHLSIAERLSERLRNEGNDIPSSPKSITNYDDDEEDDPNKANDVDAEKEMITENCDNSKEKDPLSIESPEKQPSETDDEEEEEEEEEGRLIIDEDYLEKSKTKRKSKKTNKIEKDNKKNIEEEKINNDDVIEVTVIDEESNQSQGNCHDDKAAAAEEEDDDDGEDDDDNWEDIEENITDEHPLPGKNKNMTMFATLRRLTKVVRSSRSLNSNSKKDQKSSEMKKSSKPATTLATVPTTSTTDSSQLQSKPPIQSKPGIFVIKNHRMENEKNVDTNKTLAEDTLNQDQLFMGMDIDPTLPDILLSDETLPGSDTLDNLLDDQLNLPFTQNILDIVDNPLEIAVTSLDDIEMVDIANDDTTTDKLLPQIQKIYHIGFSKVSEDDIRYRCLIDNCSFFFSTSPDGIEVHFKNEHSQLKWDGYCCSCEASISNETDLPILREINHMLEVHLKKPISQLLSSTTTNELSSNTAAIDENSNSSRNSENNKPLLKVRRFSGDKLSISKDVEVNNGNDQQQQNKPVIHNELFKKTSIPSKLSNMIHFELKKFQKEFKMTTPINQSETIAKISSEKNLNDLPSSSSTSPPPLSPSSSSQQIVKQAFIVGTDKNISISETIENDNDNEPQSFIIESSPKSNNNDTDKLQVLPKISNAYSIGALQNQSSSQIRAINSKASLKPWLKRTFSFKSNSIITKLLEDKSLYSLYKCMGNNCAFHSQSPSPMRVHLMIHDSIEKNKQQGGKKSYFECPYCMSLAFSHESYLAHMKIHEKDIYQCPYCFYRSCASFNVLIHLQRFHSNEEMKILLCIGEPKTYGTQFNVMAHKKLATVKKIPCKSCSKVFINIQNFIQHMREHDQNETGTFECGLCNSLINYKNTESHLLTTHQIGLFQCIYCAYATNSTTFIKYHLSLNHPSLLMSACMRAPKNNEKRVAMANFSVKINENIFRICRYTEDELNCNEEDSVKHKNSNQIVTYANKTKPQLKVTTITTPATIATATSSSSISITGNKEKRSLLSTLLTSPPPLSPIQSNLKIASVESMASKTYKASTSSSSTNEMSNQSMQMKIASVESMASKTHTPSASSNQNMKTCKPSAPNSSTNGTSTQNSSVKQINEERPSNSLVVPSSSSSSSNVSETISNSSNTIDETSNNDSLTMNINSESSVSNTMDRVEKAAKEFVKDTGYEGKDLYRCGFTGCDVSVDDAFKFSDHMFQHSSANTDFKCYHCNQILKSVVELKSHIRSHAKHRYFCYFCSYTSSISYNLLKHMNSSHSKSSFVTYPLITGRNDKLNDFFVVCPKNIKPIEVYQYSEHMIRRLERKKALEKRYFSPNEIDQLPIQSIFFGELYCSVCNYKTKVRINMVRHLELHLEGEVNITNVDPINPVPCLNSNEKHFDKMVNLALSSNISKDNVRTTTTTTTIPTIGTTASSSSSSTITSPSGTTATITTSDIKLPAYVADSKKLVCGVPQCSYLGLDENVFKLHLNNLHANEKTFSCPHCSEEICKRGIMFDKILQHLKYHDVKLFVCNKCHYMHYQKSIVERHISERHTTDIVQCICYERNETNVTKSIINVPGKAAINTSSSATAAVGAGPGASNVNEAKKSNCDLKWECSICKGRTVTHNQMVSHVNKKHGIRYRYMCPYCEYGATTTNQITDHAVLCHPTKLPEAKYMYYKVPDVIQHNQYEDITPLWKRDPSKVKNIRGILMEEEEDDTNQHQQNALNYEAVSYNDFSKNASRKRAGGGTSSGGSASKTPKKNSKKESQPQTVDKLKVVKHFKDVIIPVDYETSKTTSSSKSSSTSSSTSSAIKKPTPKPSVLREDSFLKIFKEPHYSCDQCPYLAKTEDDLNDHKKTFDHSSNFIAIDHTLMFTCFECSLTVNRLEDLHEHWKSKHWSTKIVSGESISTPDEPFWFRVSSQVRCGRCKFEGTFTDVEKHHEIHHSEMTLILNDIKKLDECALCQYTGQSTNAFAYHFRQVHKIKQSPCKFINNEFLTFIKKYGQIQRYILCLYCHTIFSDSFNYIHHHGHVHKSFNRDYEIIKNQTLYQCSRCHYTTVDEVIQYKHIREHEQKILRTCKVCNKVFPTINLYKKHEKLHPDYNYEVNEKDFNKGIFELYMKMKIILSNGFVFDKKQARLTDFGKMELLKMTADNLINNDAETQKKDTNDENKKSLLSSSSSVIHYNSDDESKSKSITQSNQFKNIAKRRQSVSTVSYADRNYDDNSGSEDNDDRNDISWRPSNGKKRQLKSLNVSGGCKKRIIEVKSSSSSSSKSRPSTPSPKPTTSPPEVFELEPEIELETHTLYNAPQLVVETIDLDLYKMKSEESIDCKREISLISDIEDDNSDDDDNDNDRYNNKIIEIDDD